MNMTNFKSCISIFFYCTMVICMLGNDEPFFHFSTLRDNYAFFPFRYAAKDKRILQAHHITHVLNAADGKFNVNTGPSFYRDTKITYHGVEAFDMPSFNLSPFFYPAANFIKNALSSPTGEELSPSSRHFLTFSHINLGETKKKNSASQSTEMCQSIPITAAPSCISH